MNFRKIWNNIDKIGVLVSLVVSILAIIFSIKSCDDSSEALKISKEEFRAKRSLILKSSIGSFSPGFIIKPLNPNLSLQSIKIYYPSALISTTFNVEAPGFEFWLSELQDSLAIILKELTSKYSNQKMVKLSNILVPIKIETNYIAEGENFWDASLYNLEFYYFRNQHQNEEYVEFKNLSFISRVSENINIDKTLADHWSKNISHLSKQLIKLH